MNCDSLGGGKMMTPPKQAPGGLQREINETRRSMKVKETRCVLCYYCKEEEDATNYSSKNRRVQQCLG